MTKHQLPKDDQPDRYTGCWNQVHVRTVYPDTAHRVWHLGLPGNTAGSYCTRFNPVWGCDLAGATLPTTYGGTANTGPKGLTVGNLLGSTPGPWNFKGQPLDVCPYCLTLARAEAELVSQRKYGVRGLLKQFDGAATPPA